MSQIQSGSISDIFIKRPVMTILLALTALLFGVYSFTRMPVNDLPGVNYPVIQVNVSYPGANPTIMGSNIASPLEQQFMQISGLDLVTSKNTFGYTQIILQFSMDKSIESAATDVQSAIQRAMGNLPADLPSPPSFYQDNPNDMPIYIISVLSDAMPVGQLYDYAYNQIAQRISMVSGVSKVDIYGAPRAVRVYVDVEKVYNLGMTMTDLKNSLSTTTNLYSSGNIEGPDSQFIIYPNTQLETAESYRDIIVTYKDGSPVFLRDVARVEDSLQSDTLNLSFWTRQGNCEGKSILCMGVRKSVNGNAVATVRDIQDLMEELRQELPSSVQLITFYDRAQFILDNIADVKETLYIAFVLVVGVIFLFLGRFRDTLIPAVALPFSLLLTFIFMNAFGFSLNNLSLMGLTMAIGFLVDDAIVFLENTVRRMEDFGESPLDATFASAKEISFTILSMTLSLAAVFIPLVFMTGIIGRVFREFSLTVVTATLMSGLVSLTLTPMMCSRVLQPRKKDFSDKTAIEKLSYTLEHAFLKFYSPTLTWMLKHNIVALILIAGSFGASWYFLTRLSTSFLPVGDSGFMQGAFVADSKASPKDLGRYQAEIARVLQANPAVKNYVLVSGVTSFVNSNMGFGFIILDEKSKRPPIEEVALQLRNSLGIIPGIFPAFQPQPTLQISTGATSKTLGDYAYAMSGMDTATINAAATALMQKMYTQQGKLFLTINTDLYLNNPQITINQHRQKASMLGLSADSFTTVFKDAYAKFYYYLIKSTYQQYWSIMQAKDSERAYANDIKKLSFSQDSIFTGGAVPQPIFASADSPSTDSYGEGLVSNLIPFESIGYMTETLAPIAINHINNFPSVTLYFNLMPGVSIGDATKWMESAAEEVVPNNIQKGFQGEAVTFMETIRSLLILALVAVFVMYVILGILYESYVHPITVLIALPIAVAGGLASLYFFDMPLDIYSAIGIFMLMGIVKKNGIMMVDFAIAREHEGLSPRDAVHEASMERFRPIIMTTMAALIGMLPIAFGMGEADAESRIPLGVTVVGGLIFSQIVTLYITPVFYVWMDWVQTRILDKTAFFQRGKI